MSVIEIKDDTQSGQKVYIFDGKVTFKPSSMTLEYGNPLLTITLQRPASRCLQLLLEKQYELVSQKELMVFGWGEEKEKKITVNTFYQAMYHLRQALSQADCPSLIYTVPRKGVGICNTEEHDPKERSHSEVKKNKVSILIITLAVICCVAACWSVYWYTSKDNISSVFDNYHNMRSGNCDIYFYDKSLASDKVLRLLKATTVDCNLQQTIFITATALNPRKSLLICKSYTDEQHNCSSIFFMDDSP